LNRRELDGENRRASFIGPGHPLDERVLGGAPTRDGVPQGQPIVRFTRGQCNTFQADALVGGYRPPTVDRQVGPPRAQHGEGYGSIRTVERHGEQEQDQRPGPRNSQTFRNRQLNEYAGLTLGKASTVVSRQVVRLNFSKHALTLSEFDSVSGGCHGSNSEQAGA
jgi:hypothetical protein